MEKSIGAVALEDSIMKKGSVTTAGSKILENFVAPFDAAVVKRLQSANVAIAGKADMPEFGIAPGMAGFFHGEQAGLSGAVQIIKNGTADCCLCNDLFGQYRKEAAGNGLCYVHPSYGTVSRYGLIPLASSMDQIGILCKNAKDGFLLLSVIAGKESRDGAMFPEAEYAYESGAKDITVCAPSPIVRQADAKAQEAIQDFTNQFNHIEGDIEHFDVCKQVAYVLACAEISNNISRYDGIKFGYRTARFSNLDSLYTQTRTEAFGFETKLTAIMGAAVLSAGNYITYYEKAMKIRRLVKEALSFKDYDVLVLPADDLSGYALAALAGLPSVALDYKGCGIHLIAKAKNESVLLTACKTALVEVYRR